MGGLYDQVFNAVGCGPRNSFAYIVDGDPVPLFDPVNDDLAGEAPAHGIILKCFFHGILNGTNGQPAVLVVAGAEADDKQFVFPNAILIPGIVKKCAAHRQGMGWGQGLFRAHLRFLL